MNESFHVFFHGGTGRRRDLVVFNSDGAWGHFVEALVDNAERLAEFFHAAEITVVAVSINTNGDVKLHLIVRIIWLALAYIPRYTAASEHDTREGVVESVGSRNDADALGSTFPDSVVGE